MKYAILLLLLLLLTACSLNNFTAEIVQNPIPTEQGKTTVFFCPKTNCSNEFVKLTKNSEVKCAFYDLNLKEIKDNVDELIIHKRKSGLMHNKFCIINNSIIWTGSMNPTLNGNYKNNNNVLIIESDYLAKNYLDEFKELDYEVYGKGSKVKYPTIVLNNKILNNYFCPEDNCQEKVLNELKKAKESIYFMTFSFTDQDIAQLLIEKSKDIEVKGVMEKKRINMKYNKFKFMNSSFEVFLDSNPHTLHHKTFIIDNNTVITGSYNPTGSGNKINDENIIIIREKEIVKKFLKEFESLI